MIITNLTVRKLDHNDPIYPDPIEGRPFSDVYVVEAILADGSQQHAPCFIFEDQAMTPKHASNMLMLFASAVADMQADKAA